MQNAVSYEHIQWGWITLGSAVGIAFAAAIGALLAGFGAAGFIVLGFAVVLALLFGWLTVTVDDRLVVCSFGLGLIRKRFVVADVVSAEPARNAWWWGWGIRLTPRGWLFNVSGLDAVELTMANGRHYRIGTDEPEALAKIIRSAAPRGA
jgi:hypothetical protein